MPLTREEVFALIDEKIFTNNSAQVQAADVNALLKTIYDNAPNTGFEHYIGEAFGGGVIFHLWKDSEGVEHGLVVDTDNFSVGSSWSNISSELIGTTAQSYTNGLQNSNAIVAQSGHTNSIALNCLNSTKNGFDDWYLPSIYELRSLSLNILSVSSTLLSIGKPLLSTNLLYPSSTELASNLLLSLTFNNSTISSTLKSTQTAFLAIRQF